MKRFTSAVYATGSWSSSSHAILRSTTSEGDSPASGIHHRQPDPALAEASPGDHRNAVWAKIGFQFRKKFFRRRRSPMPYALPVVHLLQWHGQGKLAVDYAYRLLRAHYSDLEAHKAYLASLLTGNRPEDIPADG